MKGSLLTVFIVMMNVVLLSAGAYAFPGYATGFQGAYPSSPLSSLSTTPGTPGNLCTVCHGASGPPLNPYGAAFQNNGSSFSAIEGLDSDGDTSTNIAEIGAGTLPGDASSYPAPPPVSAIQVPVGTFSTVYPLIDVPVVNADVTQAKPIGLGSAATGGSTITIQTQIGPYAGNVDIYFLVYVQQSGLLIMIDTTGSPQVFPGSGPFLPWKTGVTNVNESLFGGAGIPVAVLPPGTYYFGLLVTPPGDASLANYDLFVTAFQKL